MQQLIQQIEQWAEDRNLIHGSTPQKQMLKLMEEFGELCGGIAKNKPDVIKDSIGDCFVVLTILTKQWVENPKFVYDSILCGCELAKELAPSTKTESETLPVIATKHLGDLAHSIGMIDDIESNLLFTISSFVMLAINLNYDIKECLQHAYDQIKDRKGKIVEGVFVKEEDLDRKEVQDFIYHGTLSFPKDCPLVQNGGDTNYARFVMAMHDVPATLSMDITEHTRQHSLYCMYKGVKHKFINVSRLGDVFISSDLNSSSYDKRVPIEMLYAFSKE